MSSPSSSSRRFFAAGAPLWGVVWAVLALVAPPSEAAEARRERSFDARIEFNRGFVERRSDRQEAALLDLEARVPALSVSHDESFGTVRTLSSGFGYLSEAHPNEDPLKVALDFVRQNLTALGISEVDLHGYEVTDTVYSRVTGSTHIYLRQRFLGIPVFNGQLHINVNREGRVQSVNNAFVPDLGRSVRRSAAALGLAQAIRHGAEQLGLPLRREPRVLRRHGGEQQLTEVEAQGVSAAPINGQLMWLPIRRHEVELVWNYSIETGEGEDAHVYEFNVSAGEDGKVWTRFDHVSSDQYTVYPQPVESPNHTSPTPPADARSTVTDPANATASPYGWHDTDGSPGAEYTIMRGNNVHAYEDRDANNSPPGSEPDCGTSLLCNFSLDLTEAPSDYIPGAVANLFYWNNLIHDIQYRYGFDEKAGNFQMNNYGRGGAGTDYVRAEAQDGSGTNNANFFTPADGSRPRMQMFIWTSPNPDKDGDVDNGIIIHEYGHGISNRLVGGPSNVSCLSNRQQPGEGLSDWWTLAYTARPGDNGSDGRGIGTYALDQPTSGLGIRTQRYSTNPAVNNWTYSSINGMAVPHGVGSVWAQAAWEAYWSLVDDHGFDPNLYNATGDAGNQRMMLYVNEGLKNTACSPTFTDVRDGIIQAAVDNHSGEDVCRLWDAFAAFGLGSDAVSGGSNSTSPSNGFSVPAECGGGGGTGNAVFDSVLQAPKCGTVGSECDSGALLNGRDGKGPEPNQPNTIADSCSDGTSGSYHSDESNDRLRVFANDGTDFAPGDTVTVEATVWAWTTPSTDKLDLYYAADANSPSWTHITTLTPGSAGEQTLSARYTLPRGSLQAVRARFRYQGSQAACGSGNYDDHDDLVFAVDDQGGGGDPETVFFDDFESDQGWTTNPGGSDTATTGQWERGNPEATSSSGTKQLGTTVSGVNDLVTGALAGSSVGTHDIDSGVTSVRSPDIALPSSGTLTVSFSYYLAHLSNSSDADFLRVQVVGSTTRTVFQEQGAGDDDDAAWATTSADISAFAGQTVYLLIEAADADNPSLVEAGIDDVKIVKQ